MGETSLFQKTKLVTDEVEKALFGKHETIQIALSVLLANGHLLIEDIPGVGKTTLAKALARVFGGVFKRIQFTPDLLPSDVTGVSIFNQKTIEFEFREGPVFANVILADEINRATPKTQSALLECMEERQVTVDGVTHPLPDPVFVIATQNDVELSGTYPLPEAQMDRFTARLLIGYPGREDERKIMDNQAFVPIVDTLEPIMTPNDLHLLQIEARQTYVAPSLREYILDIVHATRNNPKILLGSSPRGALALLNVSQAYATLQGRDFVLPDDIKMLAPITLAHRIILKHDQRLQGRSSNNVINEVLSSIPVPLSDSMKRN